MGVTGAAHSEQVASLIPVYYDDSCLMLAERKHCNHLERAPTVDRKGSAFYLFYAHLRCGLFETVYPPMFILCQIIFHSPPELVSIRRVDEAVVIGAALSLSSSAFVLKILQVHPLFFRSE